MKTGGEERAGQRRTRRSAIPALLSRARRVDGNSWRRCAGGTRSSFCPRKGDVAATFCFNQVQYLRERERLGFFSPPWVEVSPPGRVWRLGAAQAAEVYLV